MDALYDLHPFGPEDLIPNLGNAAFHSWSTNTIQIVCPGCPLECQCYLKWHCRKPGLRPKSYTMHYILNMCTITQHTFEWINRIFSEALLSVYHITSREPRCQWRRVTMATSANLTSTGTLHCQIIVKLLEKVSNYNNGQMTTSPIFNI